MKTRDMFRNTGKLLRYVWKLCPKNIFFTVLSAFVSSSKRLAGILLPAVLINAIAVRKSFFAVLAYVLAYGIIVTVADMTAKAFRLTLTALGYGLSNRAALEVGKKGMKIEFSNWENPASLDAANKAAASTWIFMGICDLLFETLFTAVFSLAVTAYIVAKANPLVWLCLLPLSLVGVFIERKNAAAAHIADGWIAKEEKKHRYNRTVFSDICYAKEMRLFDAGSFFADKYDETGKRKVDLETKKKRTVLGYSLLGQVLYAAEGVLIYLFAIRQYAVGALTIGYFLSFFGAIRAFTSALSALLGTWPDLAEIAEYFGDFDFFLKFPEHPHHLDNPADLSKPFEIVFDRVSFAYPGTDRLVLQDIDLTVRAKEKIALVGENGSGKTTLIKLMLGLYEPTSGRVLLNGKPLREYDADSVARAVGPMFQDFQLHAFSLRENIAFLEDGRDEEIWALLEQNELREVVEALPKGLDTFHTTLLDPEGCDFSGGEKQKFAMARAQFKQPELFVLDEPTSALDPLSEMRFFDRIRMMTERQSAVFVTHRMASTKFADRIYVLKDGRIREEGNYTALMKKNGLYAELFRLQSSYYKEK